MDESDIYVDHPVIEAAAANLRNRKSNFDEILTDLEDGLRPMIGSWSGEARNFIGGIQFVPRIIDRCLLMLTSAVALGSVLFNSFAGESVETNGHQDQRAEVGAQ